MSLGLRDIFTINSKEGDGEFAVAWQKKYVKQLEDSVFEIKNIHSLKEPLTGMSILNFKACVANINAITMTANEALSFFELNRGSDDARTVNKAIKSLVEKCEKIENDTVIKSVKSELLEWLKM